MRRWIVMCSIGTLVLTGSVPPAAATFPGANGRIAFHDYYNSPPQIWSVEPAGTDPVQLTTGSRFKRDPAWSADGSMIAFGSFRSRSFDRGRLETMNADGSGRTVIAAFPRHMVASPAWSPDGSRIAFCRILAGVRARIWVIDADGSDLTALSDPEADECDPDWSPDGTTIAFAEIDSAFIAVDGGGIWTMAADGSGRMAIADVSGSASTPSWSPDGTLIAYTRWRGRHRADVFVVGADGSDRTRLTSTPRRWEFTPAWSPDGTLIAFCRGTSPSLFVSCDIRTMSPDGSNVTRVTTTPDADEFALSWQPV